MRCSLGMVVIGLWILLGAADAAFAWGPATHVGLAGSVLEQLGSLPAVIAALLARHKIAYLYGSVAADMVFAKRWSRVKQFCHHWSTGFDLLEAAPTDDGRAFAYGYLSHLAADTVAHGKFVPYQVVVSDCAVNFGHLYWELRADSDQPDASWSALKNVLRRNHAAQHTLLSAQIRGTFLPFRMNRLCFDRLNTVAAHPFFRGAVTRCAHLSRAPLSPELLDRYHRESVDRILDVLTHAHRSTLLREDPNGTSALMQVHVHRRRLRRLRRGGTPVATQLREASVGWAPNDPGPVNRRIGAA